VLAEARPSIAPGDAGLHYQATGEPGDSRPGCWDIENAGCRPAGNGVVAMAPHRLTDATIGGPKSDLGELMTDTHNG
jgi:hypothetical protein